MVTVSKKTRDLNPHAFLATIGAGRRAVLFPKKQSIFAQGDPADAVFYLQTGKVRLTVVSKTGKEATIGILSDGSFFGEGSLAGQLETNLLSRTTKSSTGVKRAMYFLNRQRKTISP
jgi:CRP-like cAMP-binding protein